MPLLLRPKGDEYEFVGECYIQGLMDGENSLNVGRRLSLITTKVILLGLTGGILFFCTLVRHPFSKLVQFAFIFYSMANQLLD